MKRDSPKPASVWNAYGKAQRIAGRKTQIASAAAPSPPPEG